MTRSYGAVARCVSVSVAALVLALLPAAWRFAEACALLMQLTAAPLPAVVARVLTHEIEEHELSLHTFAAEVRGRRYAPRSSNGAELPKLLLLHGVHAKGIDEPRLIALGRALAHAGLDVMTPELTALTHYQVLPESVSEIEMLARAWSAAQHTRSVGVIGISFAGGLALMAAAAQGGSAPIGYVVTVGAHHDLTRVCDFYAGRDVRGPDLERPGVEPHPYGARVFLRRALPTLALLLIARAAARHHLGAADQDARVDAERPADKAEDHHRSYAEPAAARHAHAATVFYIGRCSKVFPAHESPTSSGTGCRRSLRRKHMNRFRKGALFAPVQGPSQGLEVTPAETLLQGLAQKVGRVQGRQRTDFAPVFGLVGEPAAARA